MRVGADRRFRPAQAQGIGARSGIAGGADRLYVDQRGTSLADTERLGEDVVLLESVGLEKVADQTTLGEWLRAQTDASVRALCQLNSDFVKEAIERRQVAHAHVSGRVQ